MTPQRVTLITLGVSDLERAKAFYQALGWRLGQGAPEVAFYQLHGMVLALFDLVALAKDQGRVDAQFGTGAMTLAQNFTDRAEVDAAFQAALDAGATALKHRRRFFGVGIPVIMPTPTAMCGKSRAIFSGHSGKTAA
jgi:catechol 2,3-dioxygenase-like lactoylglutathione lyase family enzyme